MIKAAGVTELMDRFKMSSLSMWQITFDLLNQIITEKRFNFE